MSIRAPLDGAVMSRTLSALAAVALVTMPGLASAQRGGTPPCSLVHNCSDRWDHVLAGPALMVAFLAAAGLLLWWHIDGIGDWKRLTIAACLVAFTIYCGWHYFQTLDS